MTKIIGARNYHWQMKSALRAPKATNVTIKKQINKQSKHK